MSFMPVGRATTAMIRDSSSGMATAATVEWCVEAEVEFGAMLGWVF